MLEKMIAQISEETNQAVSFQMEDNHAWYFDGEDGTEYKVIRPEDDSQETLEIHIKNVGSEDWYDCGEFII